MNNDGFFIETIHKEYTTDDPVFFDIENFDWAKKLEMHYLELKHELAPLFDENFQGLTINPEEHIQFPKKLWKHFNFYFNGIKIDKNLSRFPITASALASIPHLINATISILEPGASILPHTGNTNAVVRAHLPLIVPASYPVCGITIAEHNISWIEGKILLFCDMHVHSAQNQSPQRRYLLMLDVMRPEYVYLKKKVCVHITAAITTNIIRNFYKKIFHIPFSNLNPSKKLVPEHTAESSNTTAPPASIKSGFHPIKIAEKATAQILLLICRIYYSFVKLQ